MRRLPDRLLTRDVELITPTVTVDRYGNEVLDWDHPTITRTRGWLSPTEAEEDTRDRDQRRIDAKLFLRADITVDASARVRIDDTDPVFEVVGPPLAFHHPRGPHHLEIGLTAITG